MRIGCGCVKLGSATSTATWKEHVRLVRAAVDAGISVFDTADVYGSGCSERILGEALRGRRDDVTLSTKGGYVFRERSAQEQRLRRQAARLLRSIDGVRSSSRPESARSSVSSPVRSGSTYDAQDFSLRHLRRAVHDSLRRLRTDYIDVYQLHGPPEQTGNVIADLDDLRRDGTVRRFGVGCESVSSAKEWVSHSGVDVLQLPFGVLDPIAASTVFDDARERTVEIWARGALGGGVLSAAIDDICATSGHPKHHTVVQLMEIATRAGIQLDELAIRWVASCSDVGLTLVGISSTDHLERNLRLGELPPLPADVLRSVAAALDDPLGSS